VQIALLGLVMLGMCTAVEQEAAGPPFYTDKTNLLFYMDENGTLQPVQTVADWQKRRAHILANMELVMGPMPDDSRHVPAEMEVVEEVQLEGFTRRKITFAVEASDRVPAYLFIPDDLHGKAPAMLCLHQTIDIGKREPSGLGGDPNLHYAKELAERGYVTLAPDYPGYGEYPQDCYERGYVSATMKGIWNHARAIDLLQSLPQVDGERIGCIGHSLGGYNTLFVAVFDQRIKVAVSSCGFNSFFKYHGGDLAGWSHDGHMPRIASVYDNDPTKMPFDWTEVLAAMAPRPVFVNAPLQDNIFAIDGVYDCLNAARPVYELFDAADKLMAVHPDCAHGFPPAIRNAAYEFIDGVLGAPSS